MNTHVTPQAVLPPPAASTASRWHAHLALRFRNTARGCRLVESRHHGPLCVQRPFYPEGSDVAHVYLLHPPGGMVSGDRLDFDLALDGDARVLCTTPGAGRAYGARRDRTPQEQLNRLTLAPGAALEWFPQELIVYPGARAHLDTRVELAGGACFAGWDLTVLGLPASDSPFTTGELRQRFSLTVDGRPILIEQLRLDMHDAAFFHAAAGLRGEPVSGVFIAGPFGADALSTLPLDALRDAPGKDAAFTRPASPLCRIGLCDNFIVGRYLGRCAQQARLLFLAWWAILRPLLWQRPLCLPAIWST